jgi:hypothetical protein
MGRSSFPVKRPELGKDILQVHANSISEKANPVFARITDQLPSWPQLNNRFHLGHSFGFLRPKVPFSRNHEHRILIVGRTISIDEDNMKLSRLAGTLLLFAAILSPYLVASEEAVRSNETLERFSRTLTGEEGRHAPSQTRYVFDRRWESPIEASSTDSQGNRWTVKIRYTNRAGTEAVATWLKNGAPTDPTEAKRHLPAMWSIFRTSNPMSP